MARADISPEIEGRPVLACHGDCKVSQFIKLIEVGEIQARCAVQSVVWWAELLRLQGEDHLAEVKDAPADAKSIMLRQELQRLGADEHVLKLDASALVQSVVWWAELHRLQTQRHGDA